MVGLSDAVLAKMRAQVLLLLPDTATIQAPNQTIDDSGAVVDGAPTETEVSCRLDPIKADNVLEAGGREALASDYMLTLPHDADVAENYTVVIGSDTYQVIMLHDDHSWRVSRRARVVKIQ